MGVLRQLLDVRQQVAQSATDAAEMHRASRSSADQRRADYFAGKVSAFRTILDILDIQVEQTDERPSRSRGRADRGAS